MYVLLWPDLIGSREAPTPSVGKRVSYRLAVRPQLSSTISDYEFNGSISVGKLKTSTIGTSVSVQGDSWEGVTDPTFFRVGTYESRLFLWVEYGILSDRGVTGTVKGVLKRPSELFDPLSSARVDVVLAELEDASPFLPYGR